jgi:hypothetical protein
MSYTLSLLLIILVCLQLLSNSDKSFISKNSLTFNIRNKDDEKYENKNLLLNKSYINIKDLNKTVTLHSNGKIIKAINKKHLIENIIKSYTYITNPKLCDIVLNNPDKYEIQILYTQINRYDNNTPVFTSYSYNMDSNKYFYPASSIKLSACVLALDKLNTLNITGLNKNTPFSYTLLNKSSSKDDKEKKTDKYSIGECIKKVLLYSDNTSFNILCDFLNKDYYNETLSKKGFNNSVIIQKIGDKTTSNYEYTPELFFYDNNDNIIYTKPKTKSSKKTVNPLAPLYKGKGYIENGKLIEGAKDFSNSNYMSIEDLQNILKSILFPEAVPEKMHFNLTKEDYSFLKQYMCMYPRESKLCSPDLPDNYMKYFMYGDSNGHIPDNIKIYNKIGRSLGYLIDNAYIHDTENNIEFLLTAVIYANENEIFNDEKYEYKEISLPFFTHLGQSIYNYEKSGRCLPDAKINKK